MARMSWCVQTRLRTPDEVELRVCDTGVGVKPGDAERIFEAFFTTKPGGLGMGLSISRTIVEAYGGRLWSEANPDRGMTFGFCLPTAGVTQSDRDTARPPPACDDAMLGAVAACAAAPGLIEEER